MSKANEILSTVDENFDELSNLYSYMAEGTIEGRIGSFTKRARGLSIKEMMSINDLAGLQAEKLIDKQKVVLEEVTKAFHTLVESIVILVGRQVRELGGLEQ
jgi:hypothetical protein